MKLINPSYEIIEQTDIYKHIELCGRTCYKSTDKITNDSAKPFVQRMIDNNHLAMLEHGTVYLHLNVSSENKDIICNDIPGIRNIKWKEAARIIEDKYRKNKYSRVNYKFPYVDHGDIYITTNLRVIEENGWQSDLKYLCEPTEQHEKRYTVKYIADIHFYKDTTRHRVFSWAIESTRFCNYFKEKFGHSVTFAYPCWLKPEEIPEFEQDLQTIENIYFKWIEKGWKAEEAAYFLIQGTKAEVIMTGFASDWQHFFDLRALGTTGKPHPSVQELALPLYNEFMNRGFIK